MSKPAIQDWIRDDIRALSAYHVADAQGMVKLDAMENPFSWDTTMLAQWREALATPAFNRYPDPSADRLQQRIREAMQVPAGQRLLLGNGSDELIHIMIAAMARSGASVMAPAPGFVMYDMIARFNQVQYVGVPLQDDFELDMPAMREAISTHKPALIFIAYPNNPTANLFKRADVEEILALAPGLVVVDEAYAPFASDSFMQDLARFDNLIVMQTVSKMGLAGLRLGYMAGPADWIEEFDKVRLPYNINVLTQQSVEFALQHKQVFDDQAAELCAQRARLLKQMAAINGLTVYPSEANFILFRITGEQAASQTAGQVTGKAGAVFEQIKQQGVLIKNMSPQGGLLQDCLRVTVGTEDENTQFLTALEKAVATVLA